MTVFIVTENVDGEVQLCAYTSEGRARAHVAQFNMMYRSETCFATVTEVEVL